MTEEYDPPLEFMAQLQTTASFNEALLLYQNNVRSLGYEGVLYGFAPTLYTADVSCFDEPTYRACGLYSDEFLAHYFEKQLVNQDFTVKAVLSGCMDELDWWHEQKKGNLSRSETRVLEISRKYGLKNGLSMPLMNNSNGYVGISICSSKERTAFERLNAEHLPILRQYSHLFNNHVWTHFRSELGRISATSILKRLTPPEKELLRLLPEGRSLKEIYGQMNKTQSRGYNILKELRQKFGDVNTNRLIYYAGLLLINDAL